MSKNNGILTFLTGVAVGAAALFLAKKENRETAQKYADIAKKQIDDWAREYNKNPEKFKQKMIAQGKDLADATWSQIKDKAEDLRTQTDLDEKAEEFVSQAAKEAKQIKKEVDKGLKQVKTEAKQVKSDVEKELKKFTDTRSAKK